MTEASLTIDKATQRAWPSMVESKPLRFAATMILYFMQGVPVGLTLLVLPSWFAANGASPVEIGAFVGFSLLPWSLKPLAGLLMDRYAYRPMGRRRAWILIAQASMVAVLFALAQTGATANDIALIGSFCFALNTCAIFNDVAVDGMTIDLVPMEERAAINGCMYGSQIVGVSAIGYLGGQLLLSGSTTSAAIVFAIIVAVPSFVVGLFRERPGERLMPWTNGYPSAECNALQQDQWLPMLKTMLRSFGSVRIVAFLIASFLFSANSAHFDTVAPILAVNVLDWSSEGYSSFASATALGAGLLGIVSTGFLVKRFGIAYLATIYTLILIAATIAGGTTFDGWEGGTTFAVIYVVQAVVGTLLMILMIAWAMMLSNPAVAASQFAVMMAIPNFGRSSMSGAAGQLIESYGYGATYLVTAVVMTVALAVFYFAARRGSQSADVNVAAVGDDKCPTR
ncbi:MFS transporter [Alteriqipengyuania sp. WL0013]|uniref:MFS transporter n=1 Tax=Alteriqipengyuania sp. WL0013 TaxID=3110773 RepID=UPI002D07A915|nr:MFS transporter [Alteriqipengyuania sp. WL0013]MEB3416811.1 MFS transporter [Alteriqipengyuania sp. WL0013]